ncbi:MAG: S8 family serine peptidase [Planctomycetes bacterium]|nr:S8 family serine peptidase [Planctomycetota bacterium]
MSQSPSTRTVRPRWTHRIAVALAAASSLAVGATTGHSDPVGVANGAVVRGPVEGHPYRPLRDPATGEKWFESETGRRFDTYRDIVIEEESHLTPLQRVLGRELAELAGDAAREATPVVVTIRFRRQPAADVSAELRPVLEAQTSPSIQRIRALLGRMAARRAAAFADRGPVSPGADESLFLDDGERAELRAARAEVASLRDRWRADVLARADADVAADQSPVATWIAQVPGAQVLASSIIVSTLSARVPAGCLTELSERFADSVARVRRPGVAHAGLNTSNGTLSSSSWWNAGYDGTSTTKIAVLDTGIDDSHPALSGAVSDKAVFLTVGKTDPFFNDDSASTDGIHFHGTHVAGIVGSRDATYQGVAKGGALMNAKCGYKTTSGGGSLTDPDIFDAGDWAATNGASGMNCSFGSYPDTTDGSTDMSLFFDAVASSLGIPVAISSGNSGSGSATVGVPGDGFNCVTVGSFDDAATSARSDDSLAGYSSRGPTLDGRRKPDVSAPGSNIASCSSSWEGAASDFISASGTSMAAPQVAGSFALLLDYGAAAFPEGIKALLMTTCRNTSPCPTTPDDNWGAGGLDLAAAYTYRNAVLEDSIFASGNPRFELVNVGSLASGGRVTAAWMRAVTSNAASAPTTYSALVDVDLYVYDEASGTQLGSSVSSVDSTEQVKVSAAATTAIAKVYRHGNAPSGPSQSGTGAIYYGLASESTFAPTTGPTIVAGPALSCAFTAIPAYVAGGAAFAVSVRVSNSGDLAANATTLTLALPTGYTVASSGATSASATLPRIAAGGNQTATFTLRSATGPSGTRTFTATAADTSYGETWTSAASQTTHTLDVDAPTGTLTVAGGAPYTTVPGVSLTLTSSDALSGVSEMRLSHDGVTWDAWAPVATTGTRTLVGADGAKAVYVQFRDAVGNVSAAISDGIVLDTTAPSVSISIADGAAWTTTRVVAVGCSASDATSGVARMRFSDDGVSWGAWSAYAAASARTLPSGDGTQRAWIQVDDAAGNISASAQDAIGLDTVAPTGSIDLAGGASWTTTASLTGALGATDATSGVADMRFSDDGSTWGSWTAFAATAPRTLPGADGTKSQYVQFRDVAGNVSSSASDTIGLDRVAPTASVTIGGGVAWTSSSAASLALASTDATSGVSEMRLSDDGVTWDAWVPYATSAARSLSGADGTKTVYAQFRDVAGNVSSAAEDSVGLDRTSPVASLVVNGGAAWTTTRDASIDCVASDAGSGVARMRFSDDGVSWGAWTAYVAAGSRTLPAGDGAQRVYLQVDDVAGNVSAAAQDAIGLDTVAPSGSLVLAGGASWTTSATVAVACGATDATSGVADMRFSEDGATWGPWAAFATTSSSALSGADGAKTQYVQFRDVAGNASVAAIDTIGLDRAAPAVSLSIDSGAVWASTSSVSLGVTASDTTSGAADMRFSDDGTTWSAWTPVAAAAPWTLPGADSSAVLVFAQVRDIAGNVSASASDPIGLDRVAPTGNMTIDGGAVATNEVLATLSLAWSDATSGVSDVRCRSDGGAWSAWAPATPEAAWSLAAIEGARRVEVAFRDAAGNVSVPAGDTILLDRTPPTGSFVLSGGVRFLPAVRPLVAATASADAPVGPLSESGAGVSDFRFSFDAGATWSAWARLGGADVTIPRPSDFDDRVATVTGEFRDAAGNVSAWSQGAVHLLAARPQDISAAASVSGGLDAAADVDAYRLDLLQGDRIDLAESRPAFRAGVRLEVLGPAGDRIADNRTSSSGAIRGFRAPESGTYTLVVLADDPLAVRVGYSVGIARKGVRSVSLSGVAASVEGRAEIPFTGSGGRTVSGRLSATLDAADIPLRRPDGREGALPAHYRGRGSWDILRHELEGGAGNWTIVVPTSQAEVPWSLRVAPVKPLRRLAETPLPTAP